MGKYRGSSLPEQPAQSLHSSCTEEYSTFLFLQSLGNVIVTSKTSGTPLLSQPPRQRALAWSDPPQPPTSGLKLSQDWFYLALASRVMRPEHNPRNITITREPTIHTTRVFGAHGREGRLTTQPQQLKRTGWAPRAQPQLRAMQKESSLGAPKAHCWEKLQNSPSWCSHVPEGPPGTVTQLYLHQRWKSKRKKSGTALLHLLQYVGNFLSD